MINTELLTTFEHTYQGRKA